MLNGLGVVHECDRRTDRQTEPPLEIARSTTTCAKNCKTDRGILR